ncbi:hypothetical protein BG52_13190 [Paenibacillus darwinianus]|nr:hypothetical protein CH50_05985 [Paenibacillus darwinianus]EXX90596.1 hypothetical protein BG52_13190 [Paenibacillus darwinianus]
MHAPGGTAALIAYYLFDSVPSSHTVLSAAGFLLPAGAAISGTPAYTSPTSHSFSSIPSASFIRAW